MIEETALNPECYKRHAEIENHISSSVFARGLIVTLTIAMILQIGGFLILWGRLTQLVEINTTRITTLESIHPRGGLNGK